MPDATMDWLLVASIANGIVLVLILGVGAIGLSHLFEIRQRLHNIETTSDYNHEVTAGVLDKLTDWHLDWQRQHPYEPPEYEPPTDHGP